MEPQIQTENKKNSKLFIAGIASALAIVLAVGGIYFLKNTEPDFCFTFAYDTQFGDKADLKESDMSNEAFYADNGNPYYIPEVPALQQALMEEGFYIDPYENTGGGVYLSAFFGPSTKTAVMDFQRKRGLEVTGEVGNDMIDLLNNSYACPPPEEKNATTTPSSAATTSASTGTR